MKASLAIAVVFMTVNAAGASAQHQAARRVDLTRYSTAALLAVDVPWSTVKAIAGPSFWPEPPSFNTIVDEEDPQPLTAIAQRYDQVGGKQSISTALAAYSNAEISLEYLQSSAIVNERIDQESPAVGDQHFYYTTTLADGRPSTRFYFIRGPIGATVQINGAIWSRSRIAKLATPIDAQIQLLLAGKLQLPTIPASELAHLPTNGSAAGQILGTASIPAEAWATIVHKGSPRAIRDSLVKNGDATVPFRRYLRKGSRADVLETTLFTFPTTAAAQTWFAPFAAGVRRHPTDSLNTGNTGNQSAFRFELDNYELQFVVGRYVADVFCWAPFVSNASTECEAAARELGEQWYAQLRSSR